MSRNYSPRNFLQKTPNALLKQFFEHRHVNLKLDWAALAESDAAPIEEAIQKLEDKVRVQTENLFRAVNELACDKGTLILIEEGQFHEVELADTFRAMGNAYEIAMWTFLNQRIVFDVAESLYRMDCVGSWKQCAIYRGLSPKVEREEIDKFAEEVIAFYKKQGRGRHCEVRNYRRENPERHCYFAYPEDYAKTELEYNDDGILDNRNIRPAFEVIFVYRPESGILETNARGKASDVKTLQEAFCKTILDLDKMPDKNSREINLETLKDRFGFPFSPQDGIRRVSLKLLQVELLEGKRRRLTFEEGSNDGGQPIYDLINAALDQKSIPLAEVVATKAKIQFEFDGINGKKGKTLSFDIGTPDHCTLKDEPLHLVAKKYLEQWGLVKKADLPPMPEPEDEPEDVPDDEDNRDAA